MRYNLQMVSLILADAFGLAYIVDMPNSGLLSNTSNALVVVKSSAPGSFEQQGSLSWTDLASQTVQLSVNVLQRLAAADVDAYTLYNGQTIARLFKFGNKGWDRFEEAIMKLPSMRSWGNIIHFGFGIDSPIRSLSSTEDGACLVAFCAALAECYPTVYAASVLRSMSRSLAAPDQPVPSSLKWKALIKLCKGSLAQCSFPIYTGHFVSLMGISKAKREIQFQSDPDTLTRALIGIGNVSRGKVESITIVGGYDIACLAAIATWLFDLLIVITNVNGDVLYINCEDEADAQIRFMDIDGDSQIKSSDLRINDSVFVLHTIAEIIDDKIGMVVHRYRVPWDNLFSTLFGSAFKRLLEQGPCFGLNFGCLVRLLQASTSLELRELANGHPEIYSRRRLGYGTILVTFACIKFPELRQLRQAMDQGLGKNRADAEEIYVECLRELKRCCNCARCGRKDLVERDVFCLCMIAMMVPQLLLVLADASIPSELYPLAQFFYDFHESLDIEHASRNFEIDGAYFVTLGRKARFDLLTRMFGAEICGRNLYGTRHDNREYDWPENISAISYGGITVFMGSLLGIHEGPGGAGICHVIPGQISTSDELYDKITDMKDNKAQLIVPFDPFLGPHQSLYFKTHAFNYNQSSLIASESADGLQVGLLLKGSTCPNLVSGPAQYFIRHERILLPPPCSCVFSNEGMPSGFTELKELSGSDKLWHFKGNSLTCIAALMLLSDEDYAILRVRECLACCMSMVVERTLTQSNTISPRKWMILSPNAPDAGDAG